MTDGARNRALSSAPDPILASVMQSDATVQLDDGRAMHVCFRFPPNIEEIARTFPLARTAPMVVFAFGHTLYNPHRAEISKWLLAHELEHTKQQGRSPENWWKNYIADVVFRFDSELAAHQSEYAMLRKMERNPEKRSRETRFIAQRLSGPLYGNMISFGEALLKIRGK